jgi:diguanylate cyclase (GGDEF)-like protein
MAKEFNFYELKVSDRLPSPTGTALAVMKLAQREDVTVQEIGHLVQSDPALTARILRLANSPAIGARRPVVSVLDAVVLLGMKTVCQFALGLSLIGKYARGCCEAFDYPAYWSTSLAYAVAIQTLAGRERCVAPEEAFTLGLLAEIGRLALATAWPDEYGTCLQQAQGEALLGLEKERFAIDHDALSLMLLADWGFPAVFLDALRLSRVAEFGDASRAEHLGRQMVFARAIADYCVADAPLRTSMRPGLSERSAAFGLDEQTFERLLEQVETQWHDWGRLSGIDTRFRRSLPEQNAEDTPPPGGLSVLLVDDDPMMLARLSKQLAAGGHHVATCRDGGAALKYVVEHKPQLVITDWRMKPMDGLQLCRSLRASVFGKSLYLIMLTSNEDEDALVEAFDAGIDDYVVKPPNLKVLQARIRAGQRIVALQQDLAREHAEIERYSAELAVANRRLEQMANTDLLTGLPNRRYALNRLEQEWAAAIRFNRPLSVMMLDLDHFKSINDTLGHDAGDRVLAHAAKILREAVRASDIACRMGGEEFLVIASNTDGAAALRLAERIRAAIELRQPDAITLPRNLTISIGVAATAGAQPGWKELIKLADQALYAVKQARRNGVKLAS